MYIGTVLIIPTHEVFCDLRLDRTKKVNYKDYYVAASTPMHDNVLFIILLYYIIVDSLIVLNLKKNM